MNGEFLICWISTHTSKERFKHNTCVVVVPENALLLRLLHFEKKNH
jgi:hypothetical protein